MPNAQSKLVFPRILKATLRNFSLYASQPLISVSFPEGVFCLAGANGLGKSTFLSAINYALTGIVANPNRRFESVEEYYRYHLEYPAEFFAGRINEIDRASAEVSVEFAVANHLYSITRSPFEREQLRTLSVVTSGESDEPIVDGTWLSPADRESEYERQIMADIGLDSFSQFVFVQHFLLTFDERRHLLFWDQRVLEQALFLAFSVDQNDAKRADTLRKEMEAHASRARNANWQATQLRSRMVELEAQAAAVRQPVDEELVLEHEKLTEDMENARDAVDQLESQATDATLRMSELTATQVALRSEYADIFDQHIGHRTKVERHPLVVDSMTGCRCFLCGAEDRVAVDKLTERAKSGVCPLCCSDVPEEPPNPTDLERLKAVDSQLAGTKQKMEETAQLISRLRSEIGAKQQQLLELSDRLKDFESANTDTLTRANDPNAPGELRDILRRYQQQMQEYLQRKVAEYAKRDQCRSELTKLQRSLKQRYAQGEVEFVPLFRELAGHFLGLDLDITMETNAAQGINLLLEIESAVRRQHHQLSESQRFFVDIALRMALAQYMSDPSAKACLFVDTPEGSLDIAYESRAGRMFAAFVQAGYHLIMTANINTSKLLLSLAEKCGRSHMQLCRMTSWTPLSKVQIEEGSEFEKAFDQIEKALGREEDGCHA